MIWPVVAGIVASTAGVCGLVVWSWRRRPSDRLAVLMYHKVDPAGGDPWTVTPQQLDEQWAWLHAAGYQAVSCADVIAHLDQGRPLPARPVLITFDDAYQNNRVHAFPLLARHELRATLFVPVQYVGGRNEWDGGGERLMDYAALRAAAAAGLEIGLHSYAHRNFRALSLGEIAADLERAIECLREQQVPFVPALAYPYGAIGRGWRARRRVQRLLPKLGIACALRIGNRLNRLPLGRRYAIQRIDVRAGVSLAELQSKLEPRYGGRLRPAGP